MLCRFTLTVASIAWPVNFNLTLRSFEPSVRGVRHLIELSLASAHPTPAHIIFVSSIGIFRSTQFLFFHIPERSADTKQTKTSIFRNLSPRSPLKQQCQSVRDTASRSGSPSLFSPKPQSTPACLRYRSALGRLQGPNLGRGTLQSGSQRSSNRASTSDAYPRWTT